jgi:Xaa-Pro aminopeptidase
VEFTIVGSGPNAASPHHEVSERMIAAGDAVVLDFGGRMAGYCSDITRTVVVGEPPQDLAHVHGVVREAQKAGVAAVRPGASCEDVDRAARAVIEAAGYGERFIHRTGHGIGLEIHETPYIVQGNPTPLEAGMTFSVEPGVYLPERLGVRIEDIVAVTADGVERFNEAPRDLTVVR